MFPTCATTRGNANAGNASKQEICDRLGGQSAAYIACSLGLFQAFTCGGLETPVSGLMKLRKFWPALTEFANRTDAEASLSGSFHYAFHHRPDTIHRAWLLPKH